MKHILNTTQKLDQKLKMSTKMKDSLDTLQLDCNKLIDMLNEVTQNNPVFNFVPKVDGEQYFHDTYYQKKSLQEELLLQLHTNKEICNSHICEYIIESLNDHGFLSYSKETYCKDLSISLDTFEDNLSLIQSFEPIGVAAVNSLDSIFIQLNNKGYQLAIKVLSEFEEEILNQDYRRIAKELDISLDKIHSIFEQIQECNPYPCADYINDTDQIVTAEFKINVIDDEIEIIPNDIGSIYIMDEFKEYSKELKVYFNEAYFYVDMITKRNQTLLVLINELVAVQKNHFLYNDELQAVSLKIIADRTGFHESTVSRALSNKYYEFGGEVLPIRNLFVSKTKAGSSKDSIIKAIQELIKNEDKKHPYSDEELVMELQELELSVSRRAIAKYRTQLNILNSNKRKQKK